MVQDIAFSVSSTYVRAASTTVIGPVDHKRLESLEEVLGSRQISEPPMQKRLERTSTSLDAALMVVERKLAQKDQDDR